MLLPRAYNIVMSAPIENKFSVDATLPNGFTVTPYLSNLLGPAGLFSGPTISSETHHVFRFVMADAVPIYLLVCTAESIKVMGLFPFNDLS